MFTHRDIFKSEGGGIFTEFTEDTKLNFHRQSDCSAYAINEAFIADLFSISFMKLIDLHALKRVLSLNAKVSVSSEFALHFYT